MAEEIDPKDFPGNSLKGRQEEKKDDGPHKLTKVITGNVVRKKKSWWDKFTEAFVGEDGKSVGAFIMWDVLVPAAKNTLSDMVTMGIERLLYGEGRGSDRIRRDRGRSIVSYDRFYPNRDRDRERTRRVERPERSEPRDRSRQLVEEFIFSTRVDAEEVLGNLVSQIEEYDAATVADFYDLVDETSEYTDNRYGWFNLRDAEIRTVREGYILALPKAVELGS